MIILLLIVLCFCILVYTDSAFNLVDRLLRKNTDIIMVLIIIIYSIIALFRLGQTYAPQTFFQAQQDNMQFTVEFDGLKDIHSIFTYSGIGENQQGNAVCGEFNVFYSVDGKEFSYLCNIQSGLYSWSKTFSPIKARQVMFVAENEGAVLYEVAFKDVFGEVIDTTLIDYNDEVINTAKNVFDELQLVPKDTSYFNSMYFDEIYHARSAFEQINGYPVYETTHPPLGKTIISMGIRIFGMTPFGWRILGAVCGVVMLPIIYIMVMQITKNKTASLVAMVLLSADFMHITQTRIATVDTFVVIFMMLTFLFMLFYYNSRYTSRKQFVYLALSGIFMGATISCKWNGAYPMIALAIFFFITLYKKYNASKNQDKAKIILIKTILLCVVFFVVVPFLIYFTSYIPVINAKNFAEYFEKFIQYQINMYKYHTGLDAQHFFASMWYSWPFCFKPIWYAVSSLSSGLFSSISAFGNPIIWCVTPFAAIYCLFTGIKHNKKPYILVALGYISSYLPWVFVNRLVFIYHYFPCSIFGIIAIACVVKDFAVNRKRQKIALCYIVTACVLFAVFIPVLTGFSVPREYLEFLEMFKSWHFIN